MFNGNNQVIAGVSQRTQCERLKQLTQLVHLWSPISPSLPHQQRRQQHDSPPPPLLTLEMYELKDMQELDAIVEALAPITAASGEGAQTTVSVELDRHAAELAHRIRVALHIGGASETTMPSLIIELECLHRFNLASKARSIIDYLHHHQASPTSTPTLRQHRRLLLNLDYPGVPVRRLVELAKGVCTHRGRLRGIKTFPHYPIRYKRMINWEEVPYRFHISRNRHERKL